VRCRLGASTLLEWLIPRADDDVDGALVLMPERAVGERAAGLVGEGGTEASAAAALAKFDTLARILRVGELFWLRSVFVLRCMIDLEATSLGEAEADTVPVFGPTPAPTLGDDETTEDEDDDTWKDENDTAWCKDTLPVRERVYSSPAATRNDEEAVAVFLSSGVTGADVFVGDFNVVRLAPLVVAVTMTDDFIR